MGGNGMTTMGKVTEITKKWYLTRCKRVTMQLLSIISQGDQEVSLLVRGENEKEKVASDH